MQAPRAIMRTTVLIASFALGSIGGVALSATGSVDDGSARRSCAVWTTIDLALTSAAEHPWYEFPVAVSFVHADSGQELKIEGCWDGPRRWLVRFAPPTAGTWRYRTQSSDSRLAGVGGEIEAIAPAPGQLVDNPGLRGAIRISADGRTFQYADGSPVLLLADTLWGGNTARCGLGDQADGPFHQYLADRRSKGFNTVLMRFLNGFGDEPNNPEGQRNEGGRAFLDRELTRLNPEYFRFLDRRMEAIRSAGMITAAPFSWWGKTKRCPIDFVTARRLSEYCAVRYGAFPSLWALSGEYQYALTDCGWTPRQFSALGEAVQRHNPYRTPLSIHPSSRLVAGNEHFQHQSSQAFHHEAWLDHNWLQTGQDVRSMFRIVGRTAENRALSPVKPVFCSEACYERASDPQGAYHARWQAWAAYLSGSAGYGYGAFGVWQFYDPDDREGETGKPSPETIPWPEAMQLPGSAQVRHAVDLLREFSWNRWDPGGDGALGTGARARGRGARDVSPPLCAAIPGEGYVVYLPRGNGGKLLELNDLEPRRYAASWFDPRTGNSHDVASLEYSGKRLRVPPPPTPGDEDWTFVLRTHRRQATTD